MKKPDMPSQPPVSHNPRDIAFYPVTLLTTLFWLFPYAVLIINPVLYRQWLFTEMGYVEIFTVILLVATVGLGVSVLVVRRHFPVPRYRWYLLALVLACFYLAGEEASWGQHYLHWSTPGNWNNYQHETNLHNLGLRAFNKLTWTSPKVLFSILPRLMLDLGVVAGGVIAILRGLHVFKPQAARQLAYWFWPTAVAIPIACLTVFSSAVQSILAGVGLQFTEDIVSFSELKEYAFGLCLLTYMASLWVRLRPYNTEASLAKRPKTL